MSLEVDISHRQGAFDLQASFRSDGRLTALFGRSGSGKTTLVNAIAGLVRPQRGRIAVDGVVLLDTEAGVFVPKHRRQIGYVFQEGRLFPHLSVRQNLQFGRWFAGRRDSMPASGFDAVVDLLGIRDLLKRRPGGLSGGEKQRVAIGRALLAQPRLLLMDEPLASLDEARKAEILPYIERLRDEAGVPIVYVSHAVREVARLATTIVVLEEGRVASNGSLRETLGDRLAVSVRSDRESCTILEGRIAEHDERFGLTHVETPAGTLHVPRLTGAVGATVRVLVMARDVMLSVNRPDGISALNVLPGTVEDVAAGDGAWVDVRLRCGEADLLARLTRRSVEELGLQPGRSAFALVKSMSFDD
jgi:molybdate transport system ATP-binding protein